MAEKLVAVELDLYDIASSTVQTLWLSSGELSATINGTLVRFDPSLKVPILLGVRIPVDIGQAIRGAPIGGVIQFAINSRNEDYLAISSIGRTVRIYEGDVSDDFASLTLVYTGRIAGLTHDTVTASYSITGARLGLDGPVVDSLFGTDAPAAIQGRQQPLVIGTVYSVPAALISPDRYIYRITNADSPLPLAEIAVVRVGGVMWHKVDAGTPPGPGQWREYGSTDFQLGGSTEGGEIRVNAKSGYWAITTTRTMVDDVVAQGSGTVDPVRQGELAAIAPYLTGYATFLDPVNIQDTLDEVMAGVGGWWTETQAGKVIAGVHNAPAAPAAQTITGLHIASLTLEAVIPPVWRVRVEYSRNWQPGTQFFAAVTDAERQEMSQGGRIAQPYENTSIKTADPNAIDLPLIRSLVGTEADALAIRDRVVRAFGVERRVYNVEAYLTTVPEIYSVIEVSYGNVAGLFRVISVARSVGGGPVQLQLWG